MKKLIALIMAALLCLTLLPATALADGEDYTVQLSVTYGQTDARSMLALINDFRTGSDAWYWNSDNSTKTVCTNLNELTYDYTLEKIAMQRAAELALSFSHTRPDGSDCFTAYNEFGYNWYAVGENIAMGNGAARTVEGVFEGWQETNQGYDGQGHRRNMLSSDYTAVGIGHVYYNGVHYWVQEFASPTQNTTATEAVDSQQTVSISVAADSGITVPTEDNTAADAGDDTPAATSTPAADSETWYMLTTVEITSNTSGMSGAGSIAAVSGGALADELYIRVAVVYENTDGEQILVVNLAQVKDDGTFKVPSTQAPYGYSVKTVGLVGVTSDDAALTGAWASCAVTDIVRL